MAKEKGRKLVASNRKARHDYLIEDTYEAGLVLTGTEVKSLRMGRASLVDGCAVFDRDDELWLEGVHIPEYLNGTWTNHTPRRRRKLLLQPSRARQDPHKTTRERAHDRARSSLYFKDGRAKVEIAVAKGKKTYDKRQALRERQDNREAERAISTRRRGERLRCRAGGGVPAGAAARRLGAVLALVLMRWPAARRARPQCARRRPRLRRTSSPGAVGRAAHRGARPTGCHSTSRSTPTARSSSPRRSPGASPRGRSGTASCATSRSGPATRTARRSTGTTS